MEHFHLACMPANSAAHVPVRSRELLELDAKGVFVGERPAKRRLVATVRHPAAGRVDVPPAAAFAANDFPRTCASPEGVEQGERELDDAQVRCGFRDGVFRGCRRPARGEGEVEGEVDGTWTRESRLVIDDIDWGSEVRNRG